MNQSLWKRILAFLKRKMWNRRWQRAVTCLAAVAVFATTYALVLPAITMTKTYPTLQAEETIAWSGEELAVKVTAASEPGEAGKTIVLTAEGEGADLSGLYVFDESGVCVIRDDAGRDIELHRSIREEEVRNAKGEKVDRIDYWFNLAAGEETSFTLQLIDEVDETRFAATVEAVKQSSEEAVEKATASDAGKSAAVQTEKKDAATASASNAVTATGSNAAADAAEANKLAAEEEEKIVTEKSDEDSGFVEILDGAVINDLEPEADEDEEQTEVVANLKLSAGIGEDYEGAVRDAEKNANKRAADEDGGVAELLLQWQDVIAQKAAEAKLVSYVNGATIAVFYNNKAEIPEGASLEVSEIEEGSDEYAAYLAQTKTAVANSTASDASKEVTQARFFDITIVDEDGEEVEPKSAVKVVITYDEAVSISEDGDMNVVHFKEAETPEVFKPGTVEGGTEVGGLSFTTDSFSVYGFVQMGVLKEQILASNGNTYEVTVTYGSEANIPEGAKLQVIELAKDSEAYNYAKNAVLADKKAKNKYVDISSMGFAAVDISILDPEGQEIEPQAAVQVEMTIKTLPDVDDINKVKDTLEIQHHVETDKGVIVEQVFDGNNKASFEQETDHNVIAKGNNKAIDPNSISEKDLIYTEQNTEKPLDVSFSTETFSIYSVTWYQYGWGGGWKTANIHYGYMEGGEFKEFPDGTPNADYNVNNGFAFLKYDVDDYKYSYTYRGNNTNNKIPPVLRYSDGRWQYTTDFDESHYTNDTYQSNMSWIKISSNENIYVVYDEEEAPEEGGSPTIDPSTETWPEGEDAPQFSKSSVNNDDNTNTITLSIAAAEKEIENKTKADVIVVFDVSGSMRYNMAGTGNKYGNNNTRADQINRDARLAIARKAVNEMADTLLSKNTGSNVGDNALVRMSLIKFSTSAVEVRDFTDTASTFESSVNALTASGGTNWEEALDLANHKSVRDDAATYIVFVSDGDPTFRVSRGEYSDAQIDMLRGRSTNGGYYRDSYFPYHRSNSVFGTGTSDGDDAQYTVRNYNPAVDVVKSIKNSSKNFYAVGVSNDVTLMETLVTDGGYTSENYKDGSDAEKLAEAFEEIASSISSALGFGNVEITDGITELTNMSMKVMQTVDPNSFKYYRYGGENNKYGTSETDMQEWTSREEDGCAAASYNSSTGAVEWNMGAGFQLEDGVTYVVQFRVWPSQDAYDLVADLNNGVRVYAEGSENSITAEERAQVHEIKAPSTDEDGNIVQGEYALKTNTDTVEATYNKTTKTGDVVSVSSTEPIAATYHPGTIEEMDLESMQLTIKKVFEDGLTYQSSTGQGEDRPDSVTLVLQRRAGNTFDASEDTGFAPYPDETSSEILLNASNNWTATMFVAPGLKSGDEILEKGYDFLITEPNINYHYDLIREVINPMIVNGVDTYYGDGTLLNGEEVAEYTDRSLTAVNRVKSSIDVRKITYDNDGSTEIKPDDEFTIHGSLVDSDGEGFTFNPAWDDRTDKSYDSSSNPDWIAHQNDTGAFHIYDQEGNRIGYKIHVDDTSDFTITLKGGQYVRFINVPEGCKFEFYEDTGTDSMPSNFEWVSSTGVTQHRETPGGDFVQTGDTQPTVSDGKVSLDNVVGDKQYSVTFNNKRIDAVPEVELVKVDKVDNTQKLNGAEFKLYADAEKNTEITKNADGDVLAIATGNKEGSDGPDGWYYIGPLDAGTYYLYETLAPKYHVLDEETPVKITVTKTTDSYTVTATKNENSVLSQDSTTGIYTVTVENDRSTRWVQFKKIDMSGNALGGAVFSFNNGSGTNIELTSYPRDTTVEEKDVSGLMKDSSNVYTFELVYSESAYTLTETNAPGGYDPLTDVVDVFVTPTGVNAKLGDTTTQYTVTGTGTEEDPYVVSITNSNGKVLPHTGGPGTVPYTLSGLMLLIASALLYGFRMRRGERRLM